MDISSVAANTGVQYEAKILEQHRRIQKPSQIMTQRTQV